jgi:hypothetical protein
VEHLDGIEPKYHEERIRGPRDFGQGAIGRRAPDAVAK